MLPDRVSNPGPLTYESGALPIALRGPASGRYVKFFVILFRFLYLPQITTLKCSKSATAKLPVIHSIIIICLSIGPPKNGKFIIFRCLKILAHYIIVCLSIETPNNHHFPFGSN